jgi:hypothetical protein
MEDKANANVDEEEHLMILGLFYNYKRTRTPLPNVEVQSV